MPFVTRQQQTEWKQISSDSSDIEDREQEDEGVLDSHSFNVEKFIIIDFAFSFPLVNIDGKINHLSKLETLCCGFHEIAVLTLGRVAPVGR
jgi:hypothetical protein